jgi:hypothetical protein
LIELVLEIENKFQWWNRFRRAREMSNIVFEIERTNPASRHRLIEPIGLRSRLMTGQFQEFQMTTIARVLARKFPANNVEVEALKTIAMFVAVGLFVSLLFATYGLDISVGFF